MAIVKPAAKNTGMRPTVDGRWVDTLVGMECITVRLWTDGVITAGHSRLDRVTRRIIPTQLTDAVWTKDTAVTGALALYMSAQEYYGRACGEPVLPF